MHNTKTPPASHTSPFCTRSKAPLLSCSHHTHKQANIHIQPFINNTYTHLSLLLIIKGRVGGFLRPWKTPHRVFDFTSCFRRLVQCTPYMYGVLFWRPQALPLVPTFWEETAPPPHSVALKGQKIVSVDTCSTLPGRATTSYQGEENQAILEEACRYRSPYSIVSTIYNLKVRPGLSGKSMLVIEGKSNNLAELRTRWTLKHGADGGGLGGLLSQAFFVLTRRKQLFWRMQGQGLPLLKTSKKTRSLLWKSFIPPSSNSSLSILISENWEFEMCGLCVITLKAIAFLLRPPLVFVIS